MSRTASKAGRAGSAPSRRRLRRGLLVAVPVGVVALAGAYVGLAATQARTLPRGTVIAGRHVGGMTAARARAVIDAAATAQDATPVTVHVDGRTLALRPDRSGLALRTTGVLNGLGGFSLDPVTVWQRAVGDGPHRDLTPVVDQATLRGAISAASAGIGGAPRDAAVGFVDGRVEMTASVPGERVDAAAVARAITSGWPRTTSFTAQLAQRPAPVDDAEARRYVAEFADPAMSGPVVVQVAGRRTSLTVGEISHLLATSSAGGRLQTTVDTVALTRLLDEQAGALTTPAVDAKLRYVDGKSSIVPGTPGAAPVTDGADRLLLAALTAPDRTMALQTTPVQPTVSAAELARTKLGTQLISQFVSPFPTGAENAARTHNIQVGLAKLNGIVVEPGQTFSLLDTLRPFDAAHGYVDAPTLQDGIDVPGMGGGISQVSTTLYNATFFAGVAEVEHTPHAYWIPRYPMGREATMWDPTIDNKWTNDTGHPIRMWAGIEHDASVIRLYGVKTFTVTSTTSDKFDVVPPGPAKRLSGPKCIPQAPEDGFSVTVTRVVRDLAGAVVKNESLTTKYVPAVRVTCG